MTEEKFNLHPQFDNLPTGEFRNRGSVLFTFLMSTVPVLS